MNTFILAPYKYSKDAVSSYKKLGTVYLASDIKSRADSVKAKRDCQILVTQLQEVRKNLIDEMPGLKIVVSSTTGHNHIDTAYLKKKGIKLISLRGRKGFLKNITSTGEHTFALILALIRHVPDSFDSVKRGKWDREPFIGNQLLGKAFGIIGYGRLGRIVKRYAKAFGMRVIGYDPHVSRGQFLRDRVENVSLEKLLKISDIVSLHASYTEKTRHFFTLKHFNKMKKSAFFINTARAEIIKPGALYSALSQKKISGAATDVLYEEHEDGRHLKKEPLLSWAKSHSNLIITPHIAGASEEAMKATEDYVANLVIKQAR